MANNIVEFNINGTSYTQRPYGTCSTAAGTAAKVVTCSDFNLVTGTTVMVKFTYANTVANPTLNVNSKGAKAIYYRGAALTASSLANWGAGDVVEFRYNGTQWDLLNVGNTNTDTNTTYDGHYSPSGSAKTGTASGNTLNFGGAVVTGLTYDDKGHVTGFTTSELPSNPNTDTDTKVTQTVTTSNANYPLLLAPSGQTTTTTTTSYFASGLTYNPYTGEIENDDPLKLSGNGAMMELDGSDVILTLDDDGVVRTTSANNTSLGNSTYPWKALYATTIYEEGTALSSKYQAKGTYATSDTKNTAGSTNTTSKIFLIGATSQEANPQTYSHSSVYVETVSSTSHLVSTGGFYESSDERLKDFGEGLRVDLDALSKIRKSYFTFKDKPEDPQIGVSAQEIQKLYPEVVIETSDGHLNVDYAKLSVVALAAIDQLNDKVKSLEDRLDRLEKLLENK